MTNRFKGLNPIVDRAPEELWVEVEHRTWGSNQNHLQRKEMQKKAKWLSEALTNSWEKKKEKQKPKEKGKDIPKYRAQDISQSWKETFKL